MSNSFEITCKTLDETKKLAKSFAKQIKNGCFVNLYGEIGAGKTAFVKFVAEAMDVQEKVTSPSFVILNEYHSGFLPIYHFDLYRLENIGVKSIAEELREYSEGEFVTFVEWAEFSQGEIPFNRISINVIYADENSRKFSFKAFGERELMIVKGLKNVYIGV